MRHWFEPIADHLGGAYLRYSFTKGTENEIAFLWEALGLSEGDRVLDVGCGPGRHAHALHARGAWVTGADISWRFVQLASGRPGPRFVRADARAMPVRAGGFDAVISICQGAFGLTARSPDLPRDRSVPGPDPDAEIMGEISRVLRPGGRAAISAFSAYFQVRYLEEGDRFDAASGVNHETTSVRGEDGADWETDLWTTCYTPRELRLRAERSGLEVRHIWSVSPGAYGALAPDLDHPEFLLLAQRPV